MKQNKSKTKIEYELWSNLYQEGTEIPTLLARQNDLSACLRQAESCYLRRGEILTVKKCLTEVFEEEIQQWRSKIM